MGQVNELDLLTLIVAVSVYVATIRLVVLDRLSGDPKPPVDKRKKYKTFLRFLAPVDLAMVTAGTLLFLKLFWGDLFGGVSPVWFPLAIVRALFFAVIILVLHHLYAVLRSLLA
jgi:hypothetical protein